MEGQERSLLALQHWINTISMQRELVLSNGAIQLQSWLKGRALYLLMGNILVDSDNHNWTKLKFSQRAHHTELIAAIEFFDRLDH